MQIPDMIQQKLLNALSLSTLPDKREQSHKQV